MNPDMENYDNVWISQILKHASKYHSSPTLYVDEQIIGNTATDNTATAPAAPQPEPVPRLEALRKLQVSGATEEEINNMIDYLHEVLLEKRKESLLELEPGLERD